MKRIVVSILATLLIAGGLSAQSYTLKVATWHAGDHPISLGLQKFKELVEARTNGAVKVNLFANSALGTEDTYIDSVKKGNVEMGITGTLMGRDVPVINLFELPFLFNGWDHARKVFFGPIGQEMVAPLPEKAGVRLITYFAEGFRVISSNKDLSTFEKLKGQRIRIPNTPVYVNMVKGFGANPVTTTFAEIFTAIESKVADGMENPPATYRSSRFYEVQKNFLYSNHMFSPRLLIINEKLYQSMPPAIQGAITSSAREAAEYEWKMLEESELADLKFMQKEGAKLIEPNETYKQKLRDSQKSTYEWFFAQYPDAKSFFEKIRAIK